MNLDDYIKKLRELQASGYGSFPVVVADWYGNYAIANERVAEHISICSDRYISVEGKSTTSKVVMLARAQINVS
jgi:hypothetical protein